MIEIIEIAAAIALRRPRIAAGILAGECVPVTYTMLAIFPTTATDQIIETHLTEDINCDLLVCDSVYSVLRPGYNVGSLFRGQEEVNNTLIPGIGIELEINDCPDALVSSEGTPIEHVLRPSPLPLRMCRPFFLPARSGLTARLSLLRTVDPTELPMQVYITLVGYRMVCGFWSTAGLPQVDDFLHGWLGARYPRRADPT